LPILIIAPTSLLFHWRREIETFLPGREVYVHSGTKRFQDPDFLKEQRIVLTSYALVRQDIDLLNAVSWEAIILDEAQSIKNPDSLAAKCIRALGGKFRLAITGTPVENRPDDLWSLFAFLVPELLGDRPQFNAKIEAAALDERHLHRLKRKLRPFLLQRRKSEVALQLPPKIEQVVWVEMEEEQKTLYEEWMAAQRRGLLKKVKEEGVAAHRMEVLEAILRLRQICCAPQLVDAEKTISSAKLERVLSDLEEVIAKKSKVLIYSQFTLMLHLIEKEIIQRGWRFVSLDGSTKNREQVVTAFQEDPEISIFLISLKAGGVGLNLTAADYIFLYDPWWNEAVENQAIDRAHRVGREGAVIARRYLTANSIEEKMVRLKESKSALSKGLLSFEETLHQITLNDLCALLEE
jgi:SNF2 family DNA or RNA helicase